MINTVLGWLQAIERFSPAELGWSADTPAPEVALTAVAVARHLVTVAEDYPLLRQCGPVPHEAGAGRFVAAVLARIGPLTRVQLDPRITSAGDLRDHAAALADAVSARRHRDEEEAGIEAVKQAGREAWRIHHQQRGAGP